MPPTLAPSRSVRKPQSAAVRKSPSTTARKGSQRTTLRDGYSASVDAYIAAAAPFAQPILAHIREVIHKALPEVEEAIKWSMPFFLYRGLMLGNMAAFKQHCSFGLWGREAAAELRADDLYDRKAMGVLGRLTSLNDLPSDRDFTRYLRAAAAEIATGARTTNYSRPKSTTPKPPPEVPPALAAALKHNMAARTHFAAMAPGCQREYCDWIAEAKRDDTRAKRVSTAIEWIAEGKRRNWKYEA